MPLVHNDKYKTQNTSRVDESTFTTPDTTEQIKKIKRDELAELYEHVNGTSNLYVIDLNRFRLTANNLKR